MSAQLYRRLDGSLLRPLMAGKYASGGWREDESIRASHDGAEEGRRPSFRKNEIQPSEREVQEHTMTRIPVVVL